MSDLIARLEAAARDERLSTGALYMEAADALRAQLLAARAAHFEEAAKIAEVYPPTAPPPGLVAAFAIDFECSPQNAFEAAIRATASRIAAALRAKGAGK